MSPRPRQRSDERLRPAAGLWALALGATGFVAGFFGPIALNPDANQGPLVGLFITGPGGVVAGLVLGLLFRVLPVTNALRARALLGACAVLALGTLWFCLPQPAVLGYVVDATVADCARPAAFGKDALARWQAAVTRAPWAKPPADWPQRALANLDHDAGVVVTLKVARRAPIRQHRKPWDFGRRDLGPWQTSAAADRYYASDEGADCAAYLARPRTLYLPFDPSPGNPNRPAAVWPPIDTTGFLSLLTLGPVPAEYARLVAER
ncbi:MAG TPA: hypothetical protein VHH11_07285 [Gammaproteobacteria bacterium]|jgi:hypothetical protein|nr:hypothetical protein [Gammaproteobacteria bacterium]